VTLLLAALALAVDGGSTLLYSGATGEPVGLLSLQLKPGGKAVFKQVISMHLPPAEIEVLEVAVADKGGQVCLEPAPRAIAACLLKKGSGLEATLKDNGKRVLLEPR
jgi:hypothetical protein